MSQKTWSWRFLNVSKYERPAQPQVARPLKLREPLLTAILLHSLSRDSSLLRGSIIRWRILLRRGLLRAVWRLDLDVDAQPIAAHGRHDVDSEVAGRVVRRDFDRRAIREHLRDDGHAVLVFLAQEKHQLAVRLQGVRRTLIRLHQFDDALLYCIMVGQRIMPMNIARLDC